MSRLEDSRRNQNVREKHEGLVDGPAFIPSARRFGATLTTGRDRHLHLLALHQAWRATALEIAADAADPPNPLPYSRYVPATALTHGSTDVGIPLHDLAHPFPERFPSIAAQLRPQHVVTQLADGDVRFMGFAPGM